ncbi:MAG: class I SAM-dependent methyltransferase [Candidatus Micrarchaeaceae archaeon]|jgi:2-polyprenyl-3-methyl-5-hydroxy-6-metoxy-1,4-benzoquinol methylase
MTLPHDYSKLVEYYEVLEEGGADRNSFLEKILKNYKANKVLDFTCGTGVQTLWLTKKGYNVIGSDISSAMLKIAKQKAKDAKLNVKFYKGDMRSSKFGTFDAVITIFNAIGHLSKPDFEKTIRNIGNNLKKDGLYIFDIFDLEYMKKNFITYKFFDVAKEIKDTKLVRTNNNRLDKENGLMLINQETFIQEGLSKPKVFKERWTMQIYSKAQLRDMLKKNGFEVIGQYGIDGSKIKGMYILTVARKR